MPRLNTPEAIIADAYELGLYACRTLAGMVEEKHKGKAQKVVAAF